MTNGPNVLALIAETFSWYVEVKILFIFASRAAGNLSVLCAGGAPLNQTTKRYAIDMLDA